MALGYSRNSSRDRWSSEQMMLRSARRHYGSNAEAGDEAWIAPTS